MVMIGGVVMIFVGYFDWILVCFNEIFLCVGEIDFGEIVCELFEL